MKRQGLIRIGTPYVERGESKFFGASAKLCAEITMRNPNSGKEETRVCFFEVEEKYADGLCAERSDAFLTGLLTTAMENGLDMEWEASVSERLCYQLTTYYIPLFAKHNPDLLYGSSLRGSVSAEPIDNQGAVSTGCSGGVDSFCTILSHTGDDTPEHHRLTHLLYASHGTLDHNQERIDRFYESYLDTFRHIAADLGLGAICCYTNLHEFYKYPYYGFTHIYATIHCSVPMALQKLIAVHYESSGAYVTEFNFNLSSASGRFADQVDVFSLGCMNTETQSFYSGGMTYTRTEKENYISDNSIIQKYLTVCGMEAEGLPKGKFPNCSQCAKCLRTMTHFQILGKLDKFGNVFDIQDFHDHSSQRMGKCLALNTRNYAGLIKDEAKKRHFHFGVRAYLWAWLFYRPMEAARKTLNHVKWARKIYYRLGLDYKLKGHRSPLYDFNPADTSTPPPTHTHKSGHGKQRK